MRGASRRPDVACLQSALGAVMGRNRAAPEPELQWLEDGIRLLVTHTLSCMKVIVLGCLQLARQWRSRTNEEAD